MAYGAKDLKQVQGCFFAQRTVPSAGGLYPCHLYLALETQKIKAEKVKDQEKIDTGVYYYAPAQDSLIQIRSSIPQILAQRQEQDDSLKAFFIITASFYNSAWKYRHRAYRYMLLDSGHLVENLSMILKSLGIEHGVAYEFADTLLGDFLGIDMGMEVPLALVTIGRDHSASGLLDRFYLRTRPDFHDPHIPKTEP
ncbi:MAG: SagB/ThcOx family dehydrogenase [Desulfobacter sp.]|nr:SagB/ThcOx family dehydrogenase [Desulfobacter sp.]